MKDVVNVQWFIAKAVKMLPQLLKTARGYFPFEKSQRGNQKVLPYDTPTTNGCQ